MNILITVGLLWLVFFILMKYLEVSFPDKTYDLLDRTQITISLFYIKWRTVSLNSFFHSMGTRGKNFLKHWFLVGVVFGFIAMAMCIILLVANIFFVVVSWKKQSEQVNGVLTPVIPGVNVPTSHLGYYVFALLVAGILHEFGHAFAAVSEKCRINAFGMFLMGVYPGAYVDIGEGIQKLSPLSQLRIYCGGAWHNIVITIACCIILFLTPILVSPLYKYNSEGPYVVNVHQDSVFAGRVFPGDTILGIGTCRTKTALGYESCILNYVFPHVGNKSVGYCVHDGVLADYAVNNKSVGYCFYGNDMSQVQDFGTQSYDCFDPSYTGNLQGFVSANEHYCMIASEVMQYPMCNSHDDSVYGNCQCVFPRLAPDAALIQLHVKRAGEGGEEGEKKSIAFVGTPQELWFSFVVRDYVFRFESLSWFDIDLPYMIDKCLRYLASISGALAVLNMAPAYYLDGEWCLRPFLLLLETWLGVTILTRVNSQSPNMGMGALYPNDVSFNTLGGEEGGGETQEIKRDWVEKAILRSVSALFVVNIALSLINLAMT